MNDAIGVHKQSGHGIWRVLTVVMVMLACVLTILATAAPAFADKDDDDNTYSFYKVSSAASAFFDDALNASSGKGKENLTKDVKAGDAGDYMGFVDQNYDTGFFGATISYLSSASQRRGYDALTTDGLSNYQAYAQYGHALNVLGLDSVGYENDGFVVIIRFIAGGLLYLAWGMALVVELLFALAGYILSVFNPFRWFGQSVMAGWSLDGTTVGAPSSFFSSLASTVTHWYEVLQGAGLFIVTVLFMASVGIALLTWRGTGSIKSSLKKTVIRLLFLIAGIPVMGVLYTACLDALNLSNGAGGAPMANQVVGSTLIDFESWANKTRLALPSGDNITVTGDGTVSMSDTTPVRTIAHDVNAINTDAVDSGETSKFQLSNIDVFNDTNTIAQVDKISAMSDIIVRYMKGSYYSASQFETTAKKDLNIETNSTLADSFKDAVKFDSYQNNTLSGVSGGTATYLTNGSDGTTVSGFDEGKAGTITGASSGNGDTYFSTLAMYNYLTTEFGDSSMTVFSSKKAASGMTLRSHHSVNLVGSGVSQLIYWMNTFTILLGLVIIAIGYAFAMVVNSIGRGVRMIASLPFAMLGNLRAIAKTLTYGLMMILEVFATMLTYGLVIQLFITLNNVLVDGGANAWNTNITATMIPTVAGDSVASLVPNLFLGFMAPLLATIMDIWFVIKAMKLRKVIVKTFDEWTAGVIDRLFETPGSAQAVAGRPTAADKARGAVGKAAGAVGRGVAGYAGMRLANGAMNAISGETGHGVAGMAGLDGGGSASNDSESSSESTAENATGSREDVKAVGGAEGFDSQKALPGSGGVSGVDVTTNGPDGTGGGDGGSDSSSSESVAEGKELSKVDSLADAKSVSGEKSTHDTSKEGSASTESTDNAESSKSSKSSGSSTKSGKGVHGVKGGAAEALATDKKSQDLNKRAADGHKRKLHGVKNAVVGGAEAYLGAGTGNAALAAKGAQRAAKGIKDVKQGGAEVQAVRQERAGISPQQARQHDNLMGQYKAAIETTRSGSQATVAGVTYSNPADVRKAMNVEKKRWNNAISATVQSASPASQTRAAASGTAQNATSSPSRPSGQGGNAAGTAKKAASATKKVAEAADKAKDAAGKVV